MPQGWDFRTLGVPRESKKISNMVMWHIKSTGMTSSSECKGQTGDLGVRSKSHISLKGTYQGFSFFIANSFYMSDFVYLLRTQIIFLNVQ